MANHNITITPPPIQRKYIAVCHSEEEYQHYIEQLDEVFMCVMDSHSGEPKQYYPSTRTTNNDNEKSMTYPSTGEYVPITHVEGMDGVYFPAEEFRIIGGIDAVWGYSGWVWQDMNFINPLTDETEVLHGGHHVNVKTLDTVLTVADGYKLQHIYAFIVNQPNVETIEWFDTSGLKVIYSITNSTIPISIYIADQYGTSSDFSNVLSIIGGQHYDGTGANVVFRDNFVFRGSGGSPIHAIDFSNVRFGTYMFSPCANEPTEGSTIDVDLSNIEYIYNLYTAGSYSFNYKSKYNPILGNNIKMICSNSGYLYYGDGQTVNLNEHLGTTFEKLDVLSGVLSCPAIYTSNNGYTIPSNIYTINIPYRDDRTFPLIIGGRENGTNNGLKCGTYFDYGGPLFPYDKVTIDLNYNDAIIASGNPGRDDRALILEHYRPENIYYTRNLVAGRKFSGVTDGYPSVCEYTEPIGRLDMLLFDRCIFEKGSTLNFNCMNKTFAPFFSRMYVSKDATLNITNITGCLVLKYDITIVEEEKDFTPSNHTKHTIYSPVRFFADNLDPDNITSYKILQTNQMPIDNKIYILRASYWNYDMYYNGERQLYTMYDLTYQSQDRQQDTSLPENAFGIDVSSMDVYYWGGTIFKWENYSSLTPEQKEQVPKNEPYYYSISGFIGNNFALQSEITPRYHMRFKDFVYEMGGYTRGYRVYTGQKQSMISLKSLVLDSRIVKFQGSDLVYYLPYYEEEGTYYSAYTNSKDDYYRIICTSDTLVYFELGTWIGGFEILSRNLDIPTLETTIMNQDFNSLYQIERPSLKLREDVFYNLSQTAQNFARENFFEITLVRDE